MKRPNPLKISAILILAAAVAACTPYWAKDRETRYAKCPEVQLLQPARNWIGPPGDNWTMRGQITEFSAECKLTKTSADITVTANLQMERRGDLTQSQTINFPIALAVTKDNDIISKQIINAPVTFSEGKATAEKDVELPVSLPFVKIDNPPPDAGTAAPEDDKDKDKNKKPKDNLTAADRTVIFSFQLTPEQVDYLQQLRDNPVKLASPAPE